MDETPVEYLDPGRGRTRLGYFWTYAKPGGDVLFHWETSRAADCLCKVLPADFTGALQCDGFGVYASFVREHPQPLTSVACWAHTRRKFYEAREGSPKIIGWFLHQIQLLIQVESNLRAQGAGLKLRAATRLAHSRMNMKRKRHNVKPITLMHTARGPRRYAFNRMIQRKVAEVIQASQGESSTFEVGTTPGFT